ncbi:MAG TPA: ADP-ribosylglycohydrolase family protein [Polyangiaceae bacterium]|nr:ADP-ribosylglycohydrolase family protein [Polyangiaceae bacterium]
MPVPPLSRLSGCLLGGALGDALGYPIEFERPGTALLARYGSAAPARLRFVDSPNAGLVSDDTQMTLFTAEGLIRARLAGEADTTRFLLGAYQRWYGTQAMRPASKPVTPPRGQGLLLADARLHARRAPGNTCLSALAASFMGRALATVAEPPNDSKGCGAVMRSAPFGLLAERREQAFLQARDAGVLTHGHPSGYLSAACFAALVFDLARDVPLEVALGHADALLAIEAGSEETRELLQKARAVAARGAPSVQEIEQLGGGWTGEEALAIAVAVALGVDESNQGVAEALWRSVAHGGDSDSTGSLVGNLLGARLGREALPPSWLAELDLADLIERVACDSWQAFFGEQALDASAYPAAC